MNQMTMKIGRIARTVGIPGITKKILSSETLAAYWWNFAFF